MCRLVLRNFRWRAASLLIACASLLLPALSGNAKVIYVNGSLNTDPVPDGLTWPTAFNSIQAGIDLAAPGDEVWIAAAIYQENLSLKSGVALYGGFTGGETTASQRNWTTNIVVVDGGGTNSVVIIQEGATNDTRIDGLTVRNGKAPNGGGILCSNASPVIANNRILSNLSTSTDPFRGGGGLFCEQSFATITNNWFVSNSSTAAGGGLTAFQGSPTIVANTLVNNRSPLGGGIACRQCPPLIFRNIISANNATTLGGGIECLDASPVIQNNLIEGNMVTGPSQSGGGGISCYGQSAPVIIGNRFYFNRTLYVGGGLLGGGAIYSSATKAFQIVNNTFVGNVTTLAQTLDRGGAIRFEGVPPTIANNIVAYGSSAISGGLGPNVHHNCYFGNRTNNPVNFTTGDLVLDPRFANNSSAYWFDAHLSAGSPAIDAGDSSLAATNDIDFEGGSRTAGSGVDIGADEWDAGVPSPPFPVVRIVYVSSQGDDLNDGALWARARRSVQAAMDAAIWDGPSEVWAAAGTYVEQISLRPFVHLYGGFAGNEDSLDQRNRQFNETILDGNANRIDSVVTALAVGNWSTVDGFTIRNGRSSHGAGVYIDSCSPTIANCVIRDNHAIAVNPQIPRGGGIQCYNAFAMISNNVFEANSATLGGAIYCEGDFKTKFSPGPFIFNNRLTGNTTTNAQSQVRGGAGTYVTGSSPIIANNILTQNTASTISAGLSYGGGMMFDQFSQALVANNTIVDNRATNGGGIYLNGSSPTLINNLIAFGTSGLRSVNSTSLLQNNCVFGNTVTNYEGVADPTGTQGNISADPLLVSTSDPHLTKGSPCTDAGDDTVVERGWLDFDGQARKAGARVDIGADEFGSALPFQLTLIPSLGTAPPVLRLESEPGRSYVFEGSAEFSTWLPFSTNLATNVTIEVPDTSPSSATRFYRARTVSP